jgi:predicted alternative tryptophan synthase beta-subunit
LEKIIRATRLSKSLKNIAKIYPNSPVQRVGKKSSTTALYPSYYSYSRNGITYCQYTGITGKFGVKITENAIFLLCSLAFFG